MFNELKESFTKIDFFKSLSDFWSNISVSSVIMAIIVIFMLVGLVDKIRGNKRGYGERFDAGFHAMGDLALAVVGIIAMSPVLLLLLTPLVTPVYELIGADPAMFPGSLLALDMGGHAMSTQIAQNPAIGKYAGIIVASMMGITLCFTIPYAPTILKKEDHSIFGTGVLIGLITLPIGCIAGGLMMAVTSTPIPFIDLIINTLPVILLAAIICVGLLWKQKLMVKIFSAFGKGVMFIATIGIGLAVFQYLTGIRIPLFYLMVEENEALGKIPLEFAFWLVGVIAVVLAGAFPMILFINRRLGKIMDKFGKKAGVNSEAGTGLLTQLANSIPVWSVIGDMDKRGKLLNVVFAVSGSFVLGDVLGFTGSVEPEMVFPVILAKFTGGICAILLAVILLKRNKLKLD